MVAASVRGAGELKGLAGLAGLAGFNTEENLPMLQTAHC